MKSLPWIVEQFHPERNYWFAIAAFQLDFQAHDYAQSRVCGSFWFRVLYRKRKVKICGSLALQARAA